MVPTIFISKWAVGGKVNIILFNYDVNFAGHMEKTDGQQLVF